MRRAGWPIALRLTPAAAAPGGDPAATTWLVTCGTDQFLLDLTIPAGKADVSIPFSQGRICRYQGRDATGCLKRIARVLEAKEVKAPRERSACLRFQDAILGQNLNASLSSPPQGTWTAAKIFVADGEGEFLLNLSPQTREAKLAIKDPDYGDIVVRELAKVLSGPG